MKIRMKTRYCNGQRTIEPDQVGELPDKEARDLIEKGFAVAAGDDPSHPQEPSGGRRGAAAGKQPKAPAGKKTDPPAGGDQKNPEEEDRKDAGGE
ncbi:MAG TPA: hypothetical protein VFM54_24375 [Micromonosporaceae bacterium]|nr:hypothetical protein [Micromonosporaceae bacterium]